MRTLVVGLGLQLAAVGRDDRAHTAVAARPAPARPRRARSTRRRAATQRRRDQPSGQPHPHAGRRGPAQAVDRALRTSSRASSASRPRSDAHSTSAEDAGGEQVGPPAAPAPIAAIAASATSTSAADDQPPGAGRGDEVDDPLEAGLRARAATRAARRPCAPPPARPASNPTVGLVGRRRARDEDGVARSVDRLVGQRRAPDCEPDDARPPIAQRPHARRIRRASGASAADRPRRRRARRPPARGSRGGTGTRSSRRAPPREEAVLAAAPATRPGRRSRANGSSGADGFQMSL